MIQWRRYNPQTDGDWDQQLKRLQGSNFYQTAGWGEVKQKAGWQVTRLVALNAGTIVAMALVLFRRQPLRGAVAWLPGGVCGEPTTWAGSLKNALKTELAVLWLYLRSNQIGYEQVERLKALLRREKWSQPSVRLNSGLSLLYDTKRSQPDRLMGMSANWRHNLKRSRKHELCFDRWIEPDAASIMKIYRAMESLKGVASQVSQGELEAMFFCLKDSLVLFKCETAQGEVIAIRAYAHFNDQAFDLLAAAAPIARKLYASHGLLWALINDCHEKGISRYDLGGVDPVSNKGVYDFKHGVGSELITYLGEWECASPTLIQAAVNFVIKNKKKF